MISETLKQVGRMLIAKKLSVAFAESATAGRLTADFSLIDHAGDFLKGGIACYDASLKEALLNVDHDLIEKFTPESMEVTKAITEGLKVLIPADIHIGITGLTCPGGSETAEKPVGTMFVYALSGDKQIFSERMNFDGDRKEIVADTIQRTAQLLQNYLNTI